MQYSIIKEMDPKAKAKKRNSACRNNIIYLVQDRRSAQL